MKNVNHTEKEPEVVARITGLLIEQGKSQTELLVSLGLHPNNYSEWKAGRKRSYLLYIDEIARYLEVSPTYLLRGVEEMELSDAEKELIRLYRRLDDGGKEKLIAVVKSIEV